MATITSSNFDQTSTTKQAPFGKFLETSDGRVFRYAKAGSTALDKGKLTVASTVVANHINLSFASAPAAGAKDVTVTLGATAATADQYADGYLVIQDGTGQGRAYPIEGHAAADASTSLKVYLKEEIAVAGATGETNVDLIASSYSGVVVSAIDQADRPAGVPVVDIPADNYGWIQTGGPCSVLMDEAVVNGKAVTIGSGTAGAVEALDGAGEPEVGILSGTAGVDGEYQLVDLTIDRPSGH